jgi:hypothetical protein
MGQVGVGLEGVLVVVVEVLAFGMVVEVVRGVMSVLLVLGSNTPLNQLY